MNMTPISAPTHTAERPDYPKNYIPYPLRSQVTQVNPHLDVFWQDYLYNLFSNISAQDRRNIAEQILAPNQIFWNSEIKKFEFRGEINVPLENIVASIPANARHIRIFAEKILIHFQTFKTYNSVYQIADFLENILGQIEQLDAKNNLEYQLIKQKLYSGFIYAAARVIREKKDLEIPENRRGLNASIVKTFINEVFLKQQLLGYWFKTMRNRQVAQMSHPLLSQFLCREQKIRQLEIVRASKYLFVIGPAIESDVNPFALRRFLREESLFSNEHVLLTGAAVNTAMLVNADATYLARFKLQVENIITIESTINQAVIEFLTELELAHETELLPLLFDPIELSGMQIDKLIKERLQQYEHILIKHILEPIEFAVRRVARNADEQEYLYIGVRQLFGNILSTFKDFLSQPALLLNENAEHLFSRLVAYATFLEKRREFIFVCFQNNYQWDANHDLLQQPLHYLNQIIQANIRENDYLDTQIHELEEQLERKASFMEKMFKSNDRIHIKLEELRKQSRKIARQIHQDIFELSARFPVDVVDLAFDSLLILGENERHYAFAAGRNGVTRLPMIVSIPENPLAFHLGDFNTFLQNKMEENQVYDELADIS